LYSATRNSICVGVRRGGRRCHQEEEEGGGDGEEEDVEFDLGYVEEDFRLYFSILCRKGRKQICEEEKGEFTVTIFRVNIFCILTEQLNNFQLNCKELLSLD
jgi:hypothetical protein